MSSFFKFLIRFSEVFLCICILTFSQRLDAAYFFLVALRAVIIVTSCFLFVTLLDLICIVLLEPIDSRGWIMVCALAFLMFWLCAGYYWAVPIMYRSVRLIGTTVLVTICVVTGIVYLIDLLFNLLYGEHIPKLFKTKKREKSAKPASRRSRRSAKVDAAVSPPSTPQSTQRVGRICNLTGKQCECTHMQRVDKKKSSKRPMASKAEQVTVTSYGGTFPVSKEATPLPSPNRNQQSTYTSRTAQSSRRRSPPRECVCPVQTSRNQQEVRSQQEMRSQQEVRSSKNQTVQAPSRMQWAEIVMCGGEDKGNQVSCTTSTCLERYTPPSKMTATATAAHQTNENVDMGKEVYLNSHSQEFPSAPSLVQPLSQSIGVDPLMLQCRPARQMLPRKRCEDCCIPPFYDYDECGNKMFKRRLDVIESDGDQEYYDRFLGYENEREKASLVI